VIHAAAPNDWLQVMSPDTVDEEEWLWSRKQFEDAATSKAHVVKGVDAVIHDIFRITKQYQVITCG